MPLFAQKHTILERAHDTASVTNCLSWWGAHRFAGLWQLGARNKRDGACPIGSLTGQELEEKDTSACNQERMYPYAAGSGMGNRTLDILAEARGRGAAVGAFTVYNLEGIRAVVQAAEATGRSAILQVSGSLLVGAHGSPFGLLWVQAFGCAGGPRWLGFAMHVNLVLDWEHGAKPQRPMKLGSGVCVSDCNQNNTRFCPC